MNQETLRSFFEKEELLVPKVVDYIKNQLEVSVMEIPPEGKLCFQNRRSGDNFVMVGVLCTGEITLKYSQKSKGDNVFDYEPDLSFSLKEDQGWEQLQNALQRAKRHL